MGDPAAARWRRRLDSFRRLLRFWVLHIVLLPLLILPPAAARGVGAACSSVVWLAFPGLRRRTLRHLRLAFPAAGEAWTRRTGRAVFRWVGRAGADFLHLGRAAPPAPAGIEVRGWEHWEAALARRRGVILVTGHLGNWEMLGAWLAGLGTPVRVLYHPFQERRLDRFVRSRRERAGVRGIPADGPPLGALRALRRGEAVGILIDRVPRGESVECLFFGRPCRAAPGPARLALATGAPVLPACMVYRRGGMQVRFEAPFDPAALPAGTTPAQAVREITRWQARVLEDWIREWPEQWPWFHDRWKVRRAPAPRVEHCARPAAPSPGGLRDEDRASG